MSTGTRLIDPIRAKSAYQRLIALDRIQAQASTENMRRYYSDPLSFVMDEWPWGVPGGPLEHIAGPDDYQREFLIDLGAHVKQRNFDGKTPVAPIRMSISSANSCGKSTLGAFLGWWILRTRPMSVGQVTAGTYQQLEERTWSDLCYWGRIAKGASLFEIQKSGIYHRDQTLADKWKITPKTARPENAQSFAGQHVRNSTSWNLFDEASEVPDENYRAAYTTLMDGESMFFAWGQMLKNSGEFYNICFGQSSSAWDTRVWDGRKSSFTNKGFIKEWLEEWGEDSDYYRVHVLGLPPRASALQFIGQDLVDKARKRIHRPLDDEPLVVGYDAANGGMAKHAIAFRRGLDAKSIPPIMLPGDTPRDTVVAKLADILSDRHPQRKVTALFGDQAFGSVILERLRGSGFTNVFEVNFGDASPDKKFKNMRAYMWATMRDWMELGAIPDDEKLAQQFMAPGFDHRNGKLVLESKEDMAKRKVRSPDYADALCTTYARRVAPIVVVPPPRPNSSDSRRDSMGWYR